MRRNANRAWVVGFIVAAGLILEGCAVGQTYRYDSAPMQLASVPASGAIGLGVVDLRPYVVSGSKPEKFVGLQRGGFGNPFDVNTESGGALAIEMRDALVKSMRAKGVTVTPVAINPSEGLGGAKRSLGSTNARRLVLVALNEWKSDTMMSTALHYNVTLSVMDAKGETLATNQANGSDNLGNLGLSPGPGVTASFVHKFESLFDDPKIAAALK